MSLVNILTFSLYIVILTEATKHGPFNTHNKLFEEINSDYVKHNKIAAEIAWKSLVDPETENPELLENATDSLRELLEWRNKTCSELRYLHYEIKWETEHMRQRLLLCRGPAYTFDEAREASSLNEELRSIYANVVVCNPNPSLENVSLTNLMQVEDAILNYESQFELITSLTEESEKGFCLKRETDFAKLFQVSRNEKVLRWLWLMWREAVGPRMKDPYMKLIGVDNLASRRNGYVNVGAVWRTELEITDLRDYCRQLYRSVEPLYKLLHGVVRFYLRREYGDLVPEKGAIPAHLLGNLWSDDWQSLVDLIVPKHNINIDQSIKNLNWTAIDMVKRADDFYRSLGLPPMTETFWQESVFTRQNNSTCCHGFAANMFQNGDYRILYCAGTTAEDFYVIHHEMGHIHYYMAYENQPGIYRQGANTAFHESIGDAIMYGVLTPQHLHRLRLINDSLLTKQYGTKDNLYDENEKNEERTDVDIEPEEEMESNVEQSIEIETKASGEDVEYTTDDILLLKQALNKLPQIPFSLLIDEYRWDYFQGSINRGFENIDFWARASDLQGIVPPTGGKDHEHFDIGAKFHVPDHTPYIRYFLSSFLQVQLFEVLCKTSFFGRRVVNRDIPPTIPLHRCDIYGSRAAGKVLKDIMSRGSSQHWQEILIATTGQDEISAEPLKRYYRPLFRLLKKLVRKHGIPIGW